MTSMHPSGSTRCTAAGCDPHPLVGSASRVQKQSTNGRSASDGAYSEYRLITRSLPAGRRWLKPGGEPFSTSFPRSCYVPALMRTASDTAV